MDIDPKVKQSQWRSAGELTRQTAKPLTSKASLPSLPQAQKATPDSRASCFLEGVTFAAVHTSLEKKKVK